MKHPLLIVAVFGLVVCSGAGAAELPAKGKFLVAAEELDGSTFERTVILLLHYDETGAQGLVINRQVGARPVELIPGSEALKGYGGGLFWGGPVSMATMRVLLRTATPPPAALRVVANIYLVPVDESLAEFPLDAAHMRFFIGYAGWSPGQLDRELRLGSWHVVAATESSVFAADPDTVWDSLRPLRRLRAASDGAR